MTLRAPRTHRKSFAVAPAQHPERPERVPPALAAGLLHLDEERSGDAFPQRPAAVGAALPEQQLNRVVEPLVVDRICQPM
jgi:hypothetical protein